MSKVTQDEAKHEVNYMKKEHQRQTQPSALATQPDDATIRTSQYERFVENCSVNRATCFFFQILEEVLAHELKDNDTNEAIDHLSNLAETVLQAGIKWLQVKSLPILALSANRSLGALSVY